MKIRRSVLWPIVALILPLASCASRTAPPAVDPSWLAGTWRGSAWEVAAGQTQGHAEVAVVFANDGSWSASNGTSGTSRIHSDRLVLDGHGTDGGWVRYTLKGRHRDGVDELWGMVEASFGASSVSLKRAASP